jgi:hypothetical protein
VTEPTVAEASPDVAPPRRRSRPPLRLGGEVRRHPIGWPLLTVLLWPHRAFDDVAERPRPWLRLLLVVIIAATPAVVFTNRVDTGRLAERMLNASGRLDDVPDTERAEILERTAQGLKVGLPGAAGGRRVLFIFLVAGLAFALLRGLVPHLRFTAVLGAVVVGTAPMLLHDGIKLAQALGDHPLFLDLDNPVMSNPAALLELDARGSALGALAKAVDVFRLWSVWLCAVGLQTVSGKRNFLASSAPWVVLGASVGLDVLGALLRS